MPASEGWTPSLPNLLSGFRLVMMPVLLALAWSGQETWFVVGLAAALLSDVADGFLARRAHQASELGAKLDSWGDLALYTVIPFSVWWLWPHIVRREAVWVIMAIVSFTLPTLIGLLKFHRFTSYHTYGAKLSAALMGPSMLLLFVFDVAWPFRIAAIVFAVAEIEEIAITFVLPEWRADVPTFAHALRRSQGPATGD